MHPTAWVSEAVTFRSWVTTTDMGTGIAVGRGADPGAVVGAGGGTDRHLCCGLALAVGLSYW